MNLAGRRRSPYFPFDGPSKDQRHPLMRDVDNLEEDARVIDWFVAARGSSSKIADHAPVQRQARALQAWARGERQLQIRKARQLAAGHQLGARSIASVMDVACGRLIAFAIRRIERAWADGSIRLLAINNNFVTPTMKRATMALRPARAFRDSENEQK